MSPAYHHERFEFYVAMIVVAIIVVVAIGRYSFITDDAKILRMEVLSNNFMSGAANTRAQYFIKNAANKNPVSQPLNIAGKKIYFSADGWPASLSGPITQDYQVTDDDCYTFWQLFLQNPAPITKGMDTNSDNYYRSFALIDLCRYETVDYIAHFDYYPMDGRVVFMPTRH